MGAFVCISFLVYFAAAPVDGSTLQRYTIYCVVYWQLLYTEIQRQAITAAELDGC